MKVAGSGVCNNAAIAWLSLLSWLSDVFEVLA